MAPAPPTRSATGARHPLQWAALIFGAVFLLVGLLGLVPGITTDVDQLTIAGHHSNALLLGLFQVSVLHDVVHLPAVGMVGLGVLLGRDVARRRTERVDG